MKTKIDFSPSVPALPASQEVSARTAPSLRQRTAAAFRQSSDQLLELFDALPPQAKKDARHHLRVQQIAFEVLNEEWRQMLAAKTIDGHFALCVCGGLALPCHREENGGKYRLFAMKFSSLLTAAQACLRSILLLLALGLPIAAQAQSIAVHDLAVLVDADGSETITSVSAPAAAQRFTPLDGLLSAGYTRKVHWLRFSVQAPTAGSWWLEVMPPFLDDLRLFEPSGSGFAERRSGDRLPFASREEDYRGFIFKLALADSAPHTYYLRLQTTSSSLLTLQLWQPERFHVARDLEYTTIGTGLGFFLLILLLNLTLWVDTRESLYGWFSLFVGAQLLLFLCFLGLAAQYLLPLLPLMTDAATGASVLIFLAASPAFYRRILGIERDQRFLFNVFRIMVVLPCLLLVSLFTGHFTEAMRIAWAASVAGGLLTLYLAIGHWRLGRQESHYLLLATALTPLTSVSGALLQLGLISTDLFTNLMQVQRWSPLLVTLILQVALAVRLRRANEARRLAAQRALLAERDTQHELDVKTKLVRTLAEKNAALERMQHAERFAQGTVDAMSASLTILDANGVILSVNQAWRQIARTDGGGSDNLCEGVNYLAVCDAASGANSEGAQEMAAGIRAVIQGIQQQFELEYPFDSPTERRWFCGRVTRFEATAVIRVVVAHEDISSRKRADLAREEAQATLQKIANQAPGMVFQYHLRLDGSSWFPYVSEAIRQIYRVSPQQAFENAAAVLAVVHPDDHDAHVIAIQQSAADIAPWQQEYRVKFDDGTVRWLLGSALPQRQADGGTLWHGFITDITERRKTEAALAEKTQLLVTVLANSSVGIIFIRDRLQVWSNRRIGEMFGYTSAELENQRASLIFPTVQSQETFVRDAYPALDRDGHFNTRCEMRRKDGSLFWVSLTGTSVDRNDPGAGSIWVAEDISKQRKTEADLVVANNELTFQNEEKAKRAAELVIANDELMFQNDEKGKRAVELTTARDDAESANLAKSRFLATMSHEIRTPMNAVLGMAQILMQPNITESNRVDYVRTIFNSGQSLLVLLNDILDLSKIEAGKVELEAIELAPEQLMGEVMALFTQTAQAKGLSIEARWSGPARHYLGDRSRLRQMLSNLVGNAIKFTQQGSIRIEASELACSGPSATLEFAVVDTGIGIAKDKQDLLFQPFSQTDSSTTRNYGGTGLGLSIVHTLAQAMGGEAGVESQVGVGSRFWFRIQLDLLTAATPALASPTEPSAPAAQSPQLIGRVLVIEDNLVNQKVMQIMLGQMGLEVAVADDGQQALDALMAGENAHLILTDLQMPVLDGYSAAQHIRQWEAQTQQKRHPIIAFSADAFAGVRTRCLAAGMDEVLSKPVLQVELWAALAQWLPVAPVAPQSAPIPFVLRPVDPAAIITLLNEILPLLAQGKADALGRFKALQDLVAGSELEPEIAEAGLPLKEFGFDLTRQRLLQMASKYERRTAP